MTFIRKPFYIEPPRSGDIDEWRKWIKKDNAKAKAEKTKYTKSLKQEQLELDVPVVRKVNGIWRQTASIGFSGDKDNETLTIEQAIEPMQDNIVSQNEMKKTKRKRGTKSKARSIRRNKAKRKRK